ncbi:hypothetical protein JJB07_18345 [Tumebacillus sp. ITR2]|uniref:Uncharacterized protein n=1 Tax=Tumebacillus amylolyticus TaxID=2801339 RepID=A0ABS1JE45_9BACL|nr:hypothetical protein [Tumebacillus amylolyticus]MBL0388568.1 hypothetical protein [Tumebacillus amylolyticus]
MKTKMRTLVATLAVAAIATTVGAQSASATTYGWAAQKIVVGQKIYSDLAPAFNNGFSISADQWNYASGNGVNVNIRYTLYDAGGVSYGSIDSSGAHGGSYPPPFTHKWFVGPGNYKVQIWNIGSDPAYTAGNIYQ